MDKIKLNKIRKKIIAGDMDLVKHLKGVDIKKDLVYAALLYKTAFAMGEKKMKKAKVPDELIKELTVRKDGKKEVITHTKGIYELLKKKGYPKKDVQYLLDDFADRLKNYIADWGFPFIRNLKMELKQ